jgi:hypothetical protein
VSAAARCRPSPCPACPYRLDAPSGVWAPAEYARLPRWDGDIAEQVYAGGADRAFSCHSTPDLLCAGWVGHRDDPGDLLAVRLGVARGDIDPSVLDYRSPVPLFRSGATAAAHGVREVDQPGEAAREAIRKIVRVRPDVTPG